MKKYISILLLVFVPVIAIANVDVAKIYGKIKIVDSFPDYKVKVVNSFPDFTIQKVNSFPGVR
ncbi:hypothetical protein RHO14_08335 [Orbus wheelerorum]|uniref:hypothetical protein n=1 Tax=Orbus wheelerorum TaxID=3074111 RepID=UPI00370D6F17